jgi:hypothetical protein
MLLLLLSDAGTGGSAPPPDEGTGPSLFVVDVLDPGSALWTVEVLTAADAGAQGEEWAVEIRAE